MKRLGNWSGIAPLALICSGLAGNASAAGWQEYVYGDFGFAVSFPDAPRIESAWYQLPDGTNVPARIYTVAEPEGEYRVMIADFTTRPEGENTIINAAEAGLRKNGKVKVELPARVQAVFGRQLSVQGSDGSHTSAAVFVYQHRLYQITGTATPAAALAGSSDAIRFQQSLRFTGNTGGFLGINLLFGALRRL